MKSKNNNHSNLESKNPVKIPIFKNLAHTLILAAVIFASVMVVSNICKNVKQMYTSQPAGAGISCLFDMID